MDLEIDFLKKTQEGPINLAALKSLKQLGKIFNKEVDAPQPFKLVLESWNKFRVMAITSVVYEEFPALSKCWKHLHAELGKWTFDESMIDAWCFFNFPCHKGKSFAEIFMDREDAPEQLKTFAKSMSETRLGLYQIVMRSGTYLRLKELVTGRVLEAHNSIETPAECEISLARVLPVEGKFLIFGSPSGFPGIWKERLEMMLESKMLIYYGEGTKAYEDHMRFSGPYWISVVSENDNSDIFDPDYYKRYYQDDFKISALPDWMKPREKTGTKQIEARKKKRKSAKQARKRNR